MGTVLSISIQKANKQHPCDGYGQIGYYYSESDEEVKDLKCRGRIEPGQTYTKESIAEGGSVATWKSCQECLAFIVKNELHEE